MLEEQRGYENIKTDIRKIILRWGKHLKVDEARILRRVFVLKINSRVP